MSRACRGSRRRGGSTGVYSAALAAILRGLADHRPRLVLEAVEQIVHTRWLIPVDPADVVLQHHSVAIEAGRIRAIAPRSEIGARFCSRREIDLPTHVLMPGLVNAHGHAAMTLLRGLADDHALMDWLQHYIWPAETRWVSSEFVATGANLAIAEMLAGGTTCFSDMYFFPDAVADCAIASGIRAQIAFPILEHPSTWANDADEYLAKGLQVRDRYKANPRLSFAFGPHAPYTTSDRTLARVATLAAELDAPVHMHLHETDAEIRTSIAEHGVRPIERLQRLQLLSPRFQAVHMTHVAATDLALLKRHGMQVVHCPSSNLKLAAGFCPLRSLLDAGVTVALGTDGAASNNSLDLFAEMRLAALLAKGSSGDPTALSAHAALRMATLSGAQALGLNDRIGSIEPGKDADLIAIDMDRIECRPMYDPHSSLVYNPSAASVSHSWVEGRLLLEQRRLLSIDTDDLRERASHWQDRIAQHTRSRS
jgi:5-methylthioadenosine/S-adenosylhomocysteine deaminase